MKNPRYPRHEIPDDLFDDLTGSVGIPAAELQDGLTGLALVPDQHPCDTTST